MNNERTELTENEKLINDFFRSIVSDNHAFYVPKDKTEEAVVRVVKIESILSEWKKFREEWEELNGVVKSKKSK
jgi:hypothetical protein